MKSSPTKFPCRYKDDARQDFYNGWCHGIAATTEGPYALLEYNDGRIAVRSLDMNSWIILVPEDSESLPAES